MTGSNVFVSYAHADSKEHFDRVQKYLRITLKNIGGFEVWTDKQIKLAASWDKDIRDALDRSVCAVLLISADFLDSEYIYEQELPIILTRAKDNEEFGLIPVFVSRLPKKALEVEFTYRGKPDGHDLASTQGPNGPDSPLDAMTPDQVNSVLSDLADNIAGYLEKAGEKSLSAKKREHRPPSEAPPVLPGDNRHELVMQIERWQDRLIRRYFFAGSTQASELDIPECDAETTLRYWEPCTPFDSDLLYSLLFGDQQSLRNEILAAAFELDTRESGSPTRRALRVRLLTNDSSLAVLPWPSISHQGVPLRDYGWTIELSLQSAPDARPSFANESLSMPGPALFAVSRTADTMGHMDDIRGLFHELWPRQAVLLEAADLEDLKVELRERAPRLFYYFGAGSENTASDQYCLELPTREGRVAHLSLQELAELFGAKGPQVVYLNILDDRGCRCLTGAGVDLLTKTKAVVVHYASRLSPHEAAESGYRWLEHLLRHHSDPVIAHHYSGANRGGCWSAYQTWQTARVSHVDDDLVEYLLDRTDQSTHLLGAYGDMVTRESSLRVQFRLVIGEAGNRVTDFLRQASVYLTERALPGAFSYPTSPIRISTAVATPVDIGDAYRRHFRLGRNAQLFDCLRSEMPIHSGELQVPFLGWILEPEDELTNDSMAAVATSALEWCWEMLAINCPDDVRIISLLVIESPGRAETGVLQGALRQHEQTLRNRSRPRPSFRFREMHALTGVDESHLRDYFDSPNCGCWDNLRAEFPRLLLGDREEMPFDDAVKLIKQAKQIGWGNMAKQLADANKQLKS